MADLVNLGMHDKRPLKDQVTAHKTALLVLIEDYCVNKIKPGKQILVDLDHVYSEKEEREFMFTLLQLIQSADLELKDLHHKLQGVAKPKLMESLLQKLTDLSTDVRSLMDLFQSVPQVLFAEEAPLLQKTSVLGLFVRRMVLAFDKLAFSQVIKLHSKYKSFYDTWAQAQQKNNDDGLYNTSDLDVPLSLMDFAGPSLGQNRVRFGQNQINSTQDLTASDTGRYSQRQAEFFIAQQAFLLQHNELEALSPKKLQQKVTELLCSNPELAEAHFLSYLNNLRVNEYCGAIESLYHFFDRHTAAGSTSSSSSPAKNKFEEDPASRGFRYAALNMAALQYRFGHRTEALAALQEAIKLAQEANDHVCLQHALSWLQRLGVQGTANTAYLLDRLMTKSGELNLPYLASLGVQAFAQHNALSAAQPSSVFEFLLKSDIVNCQHSQSDLMCVSYAQKAALWHMYGRREMCSLSSQLMLNLNTADLGVYHNGEPECLALCHLARLHTQQGDDIWAIMILGAAKKRFPLHTQHCHIWMLYEQKLNFETALHRGKWAAAEQAVLNMAAINSTEANYSKAVLLKERGETDTAFDLIQKLLEDCTEQGSKKPQNPELYARLLLLQGELYCGTGNPTSAAQPLLSCLTLAKEHHFSHLVTMATLHLGFLQFCLGLPQRALSLLEEVLISVLSHGSLYDRARGQYLWARCEVAAGKKSPKAESRAALLSAVQLMNDVISWFKKMEAYHRTKDAIYYQARLYHELGFVSERNKRALEFRQLDQQHPTSNRTAVMVL